MTPNIHQVYSKGIYHGLPVIPAEHKGLTAIVTGANGVSGWHMVRVLSESPERWKKIYCLSRRPPAIPGGLPKNAEFVSVDFMIDPNELAKTLKEKNVTADYIFFYSYIHVNPKPGERMWPPEETSKANSKLINNFLEALTSANIIPKRFMLQTGAKNYGIHMGPTKMPHREPDPRIELEPNFYFPQEDALAAWCQKHGIKYTIGMPCGILGAVPDGSMNLCFPLAVYAAVQAHLGRPLEYPGSKVEWQNAQDQSSAMMNAYLEEWSVLIPQDRLGEKYNAIDNSPFTWEDFWPRLAAWYGTDWRGPKEEGLTTFQTPYDPPPRGYGGAATVSFSFLFSQWVKDPEVHKAWEEIAAKHDLTYKKLEDTDRVFGFLDGLVLQPYPFYFSMDKAHKRGWFGTTDSRECILEVFNDFAALKMIPPVPMKGGHITADS